MPAVGSTVYTQSNVYDIDYWKRYRSINSGAYEACTDELYDYLCGSSQVDDQQVYSFNAPARLEEDLSIGDTVQYQWRPAYLDEDINNAESFYVTSIEYAVTTASNIISSGIAVAAAVSPFI